jgi:inhibitor of KinA sporulation pathway (predicted exonuclease)
MSNLRLDKVVVFDLEATCWATKEENDVYRSDIIEIGACLLDVRSGEITKKTNYLVRPYDLKQAYISEYCTNLTGHTYESLKKGIPLEDACNKFKKEFGTSGKICAAYGNDYDKVKMDCGAFDIANPLSSEYLNICHLFALKNKSSKVSLAKALELIGSAFEGTQHRADDDAFNAAKVLRSILL